MVARQWPPAVRSADAHARVSDAVVLPGPVVVSLSEVVVEDLKWLVWNLTWHAANSARSRCCGDIDKAKEYAGMAAEDWRRAEEFREAVASSGRLPDGALQRLELLALAAGTAVVRATNSTSGSGDSAAAPPQGLGMKLWSRFVKVVDAAGTAVAAALQTGHRGRLARRQQVLFDWACWQITEPASKQQLPDSDRLSDLEIEQYRTEGVLGPCRALEGQELRDCQDGLDRFVKTCCGGRVKMDMVQNNHVALPWLHRLARNPHIVSVVTSLLGTEDVMLYSSDLFLREPGKSMKQHLGGGWHRDEVYYPLLEPAEDVVTVLVALSPCSRQHGCVMYERPEPERGPESGGEDEGSQGSSEDPEESEEHEVANEDLRYMELRPGEFSVHSATVWHCGGTNNTWERRDCVSLRYIPGWVRDGSGDERGYLDWAILVSGCDRGHRWRHLPAPVGEWCPRDVARRAEVYQWRFLGAGAGEDASRGEDPRDETMARWHREVGATPSQVVPLLASQGQAPATPSLRRPAQRGQLWEVVNGSPEGILVRTGRALTSWVAAGGHPPGRLERGALVEELELRGNRLRFRRRSGRGPQTGWASLCVDGWEQVVRSDKSVPEPPLAIKPEFDVQAVSIFNPQCTGKSAHAVADRIEAIAWTPRGIGDQLARCAVVFCDGHPAEVGAGDHLPGALEAACCQAGIGFLRFKYRGIGTSTTMAEAACGLAPGNARESRWTVFSLSAIDVAAAFAWTRRHISANVVVAGYSYGSSVALTTAFTQKAAAYCGISLPFSRSSSDWGPEREHARSESLRQRGLDLPALYLVGAADSKTPVAEVKRMVKLRPDGGSGAAVREIEGANHAMAGHEEEAAAACIEWIAGLLL